MIRRVLKKDIKVSSRTLNKATIIGNVGEEPKMNQTSTGSAVCTFRVATNRSWKPRDSNERQEETQWHSIVVFGRFAEVCQQIVHKSIKVFIEGRLKSTDFSKEDGSQYTKTEIVAESLIVLSQKDKPDSEYIPEYPSIKSSTIYSAN